MEAIGTIDAKDLIVRILNDVTREYYSGSEHDGTAQQFYAAKYGVPVGLVDWLVSAVDMTLEELRKRDV